MRDSFIRGLQSSQIRQRLLQNDALELDAVFNLARSLDSAMKNSSFFQPQKEIAMISPSNMNLSYSECGKQFFESENEKDTICLSTAALKNRNKLDKKCFFCGNAFHPRYKCLAKYVECYKGRKMGHFSKQCQSSK